MDKKLSNQTNLREKTLDSDFRTMFRGNLDVKNIHTLPAYLIEPNYTYRAVIYTYKHDPDRVSKFLENGWEFVVSDENDIDDRSSAPKSEKSLRSKPVECKRSGGHKAVWMRIPRDKLAEREVAKRKQRVDAMVQAGQIRRTEDGYMIIGPEYKPTL